MVNVDTVLRALQLGPATAAELALDLGGNVRLVSAVLHNLLGQERLHAKPFHAPPGQSQAPQLLYALPGHKL